MAFRKQLVLVFRGTVTILKLTEKTREMVVFAGKLLCVPLSTSILFPHVFALLFPNFYVPWETR